VGKELGLSGEQLEALRAAALLHDVGKLGVPEHIIAKPGKLTREEFEKMKTHVVIGEEILERVGFPYPVTPIVRSHHERWDVNWISRRIINEQYTCWRKNFGCSGLLRCPGFRPAIPKRTAAGRSHV
jgi:putative nucleotidyltransferase with HDIG domain